MPVEPATRRAVQRENRRPLRVPHCAKHNRRPPIVSVCRLHRIDPVVTITILTAPDQQHL